MRNRIASTWNSPNRWFILLLVASVAGIVGVGITLLFKFQRAATPQTPSAFYTPPDPLPDVEPGAVLRQETLSDSLPEGAQAWQVMYRSTDLEGKPIWDGSLIALCGDPLRQTVSYNFEKCMSR